MNFLYKTIYLHLSNVAREMNKTTMLEHPINTMNMTNRHTKQLLLLVLLFANIALYSQERDYIKWKNKSDSTFVFEVNNKEAEKFLKEGGNEKLMDKLLHTQVATFVGKWENAPTQGHFIYANINQNRIDYRYAPRMPFQVFLFHEYGLLTLQVVDAEGNIRSDAKVRIQTGKWRLFDSDVSFDKDSKTYTIDDWSEKTERILTIELDKFKAVFDLDKHIVQPWYGGRYGGDDSGPSFYSYMLTDKNKYKPDEKIRFKSYALTGNKKPIKKDLELWVQGDNYSYKKVTTVSPYNPGGFAGEFNLHDSLKLKLDKTYSMQLRNSKGAIVANTNFRYEDYELYDNKMEVKLKDPTHYYPDTNRVEIKVVDANGLIMPDMKSIITISRGTVSRSYVDLLVAPNFVLQDTIKLDNDKATIYKIPAQLFDKTDCNYTIYISTTTHDGQLLQSSHNVSFFKSHYAVKNKVVGDTINFSFYELGKEKELDADLYIDNAEKPTRISLPHAEVFKQSIKSYRVEVPQYKMSNELYTRNMYHNLDIKGGLIKDSLKLQLINPLKLDVSWYVYQGNFLLEKGFGKEIAFERANVDLDITYYLEIFYTIGGEDFVYRKIYVPKKEYLNVDIDMPSRIYPGQTVDSKIKVTDSYGQGVKDVDLTAFSYNTLLNYVVPDLPYYGNTPKGREQRDSYSIDRRSVSYSSFLTQKNYDFWNKIAALDKMEYYQFAYPDPDLHTHKVYSPDSTSYYAPIAYHDIFKYTVDTPDGTTEFAPYIMQNGMEVEVYAIELDDRPVYFRWTQQPKGYSFLTESDSYHKIMLRLHDRAIIIDNYCFDKGKKTIMSINLNKMPKSKFVRTVMIDTKDKYGKYHLTNTERNNYTPLISAIPVYDSRYIYLQKDSVKYPVHHPQFGSYSNKVLVGPLNEGYYQFMDSTKYFHEGGFSYKYSDNVVYKYPADNFPSELQYIATNNFSRLNHFNLTPKEFQRQIGFSPTEENRWFPGIISLRNTKIHVPDDKDRSGVHSLIMRSRKTGKLFIPAYKRNISDSYSRGAKSGYLYGLDKMEYGAYDVFLLYNSGVYLRYDSVPLLLSAYTELKMNNCIEHPKDSISTQWLQYQIYSQDSYNYQRGSDRNDYWVNYSRQTHFNPANDVQGTIVDEIGEPIIGASVSIKGLAIGTVTDVDGKFILDLHGHNNMLQISYIGYKSEYIEVTRGSSINVKMKPDERLLSEVVVVGYGSVMKRNVTGSVSSISSESLAGQAPEEDLEDDGDQPSKDDGDAQLYQELMALDGMRTNFSDVGFWEPALVTNRKGEAQFKVTFPDNITQWEAVVYAMNRKLKTGTARKSIKSYKPLMAELKAPQFLVAGDSSYFAASIRNYLDDKDIRGNVNFIHNGDTLIRKPINLASSYHDKLLVTASPADSLTVSYRFTRNDGYSDGEQRSIPIEKQGTEVAEGTLEFLKNNDLIEIAANDGEEVHISLTGKPIDIYMDAANYLTGYKYACNEQLASKLIGLLNYKLYLQFNKKEFKNDKEVNEIISRLLKNQNNVKLWSWWGNNSSTSYWMSAHILRALCMGRDAGYTVGLDIKQIEYDYVDIHRFRGSSLNDIEILNALADWGTEQSYKDAIEMFDHKIAKIEAHEDSLVSIYMKTKNPKDYFMRNSYQRYKLLLMEIRQKRGIEYDRSLITNNLKKDVLGSIRWVDSLHDNRYWYYNNDAANMIAYRIVKNDSLLMKHKDAMQMSILGTKKYGWNTYQASSAVAAILPDLLAEAASKDSLATVVLAGSRNERLTQFPYTTVLTQGEKLSIKKESGIPLIYSAYTITRRTKENIGEAFEVKTWVGNDRLEKGVPVRMTVEITVKQENAEHVMVEVPIPAGCSYASKYTAYSSYGEYREYFKEKTAIFFERLPEGTYYYYIDLLPRYSGSYILNPAKVELMYFPVVNANNDMRKVNINDKE